MRENTLNQDLTGKGYAKQCLSSTGPTSGSDTTRTWTALLTESMLILSAGGEGHGSSDLDIIPHVNFSPRGSDANVNGRDYFPDAERPGRHYPTDPGISCIETVFSCKAHYLRRAHLLRRACQLCRVAARKVCRALI
jgi:hypothetical protein